MTMMDATRDRGVTAAPAHDNSEPRRHLDRMELSFHTDPDREPITYTYAKKLTTLLLFERPDWNPLEIAAALDECRDQPIPKLRRAAFKVADTKGATPSTIPLVGPHWEDEPAKPRPKPTVRDSGPRMCPNHPTIPKKDCTHKDCSSGTKPAWFDDLYDASRQAAANGDPLPDHRRFIR